AFRRDSLGLVEGGRIEARFLGQTGGGHLVAGSELIEGIPDLSVCQHGVDAPPFEMWDKIASDLLGILTLNRQCFATDSCARACCGGRPADRVGCCLNGVASWCLVFWTACPVR